MPGSLKKRQKYDAIKVFVDSFAFYYKYIVTVDSTCKINSNSLTGSIIVCLTIRVTTESLCHGFQRFDRLLLVFIG